MVICIEISEQTRLDLDALREVGNYRDYADAVSMAISNQLVLHRQISKSKSVVLSDWSEPSVIRPSNGASPLSDQPEATPKIVPGVPAIFSWSPMNEPTFDAAPLPDDAFLPGREVPVDRWIFGQHNKLLPAKASCRALASLLMDPENGSQGVLLAKAAAEIAEQAVALGDYLSFLDKKFEASRDDAFSTAFPSSDAENEDKSRLRYSNQFVAAMSKQGRLTGLLMDFKLINHARSKAPKILLTSAGWKFAKLSNPVLDSIPGENLSEKLSEDEREFMLSHIRDHVPVEHWAYRTILKAVTEGKNTPEQLDNVLRLHLSARADKPFTDAFITTQRSGAVSRMADLRLIDRVRDGIRVTYVVTEQGKLFGQKVAAGVKS